MAVITDPYRMAELVMCLCGKRRNPKCPIHAKVVKMK